MRHPAAPPIYAGVSRCAVNVVKYGPSIPGAIWLIFCVTYYSHHGASGAAGYSTGAALFSLN